MDQPFRPHDLLWLRPGAAWPELPTWAGEILAQGLPVVVRRAPRAGGMIPAGVRGDTRSRRAAILLEPGRVARRAAPEDLRALVPGDPRRADLPAFRALALMQGRLPPGAAWGPTGSVGFELATGWPAVTGSSDLDLVLRCPEPVSREAARAWAEACSGLPARCDLQLDTGAGGLSLAEWAAGRAEVLLKTDEGPRLVGDPWSVPVP